MSNPPRIRTTRKSLVPSWLSTGDGELVGYSLDIIKDAFIERVRQGLLARFPQNDPTGTTTAPTDALTAMGRDRKIVRAIADSDSSYAARLLMWLDQHKTRGNPYALMDRLAEYLGPLPKIRTVDASGNWYTREANGTTSVSLKRANWNWDGLPIGNRWARFWVVIYPNGLWAVNANKWGSGAWGTGSTWPSYGTTATPEQAQTVRAIVADWKPAGTRCTNIIVSFDSADFDPALSLPSANMPDGNWGPWGKNVNGVMVESRFTDARYFGEV